MGWMGKLIGGTIGLVLGGPLGAVAGAAFGHAIDKNKYSSSFARPSGQQKAQMTFFVGAFSMLAKLVQADGRVTDAEMSSIETIMLRDLHLDPVSRQTAVRIFNSALQSGESFDTFARQFYNEFYNQPQILELMLDILLKVAVSDGVFSREEERLLERAAEIFKFETYRYRTIKGKYVTHDSKAYSVLGVEKDSPVDEIKKAYRRLVSEYHPDKIAAKGLPEEFNKFAAEKFREIQEAYDTIRKERGF